MKKLLSGGFLLISLSNLLFSQYYSTGQDPASIRWRQIKTPQFRLLYPDHYEEKAQYLANVMEIISRNETYTLKAKVPRIPLLLHTQSTVSNGVTVWAPKRIELYPCDPQSSYAEEWLEQLTIHEYRHAVQIAKINQGFSKALSYLFGEQITGGILGLYVPSWFLEGDATVTETALSKTGRGRSALFESVLRAQITEKGPYSYDKATMGSYKTFTPDAYALGYSLVGKARAKYGTDLWNEALDRVAKYPFMVVPFNSGIRKVTGKWKTRLYKELLAELDSGWQQQSQATKHPEVRTITRRDSKTWVKYSHPLFLNDTSILAEKASMDDVTRFILIDRRNGSEKVLLTPGKHNSGTTSIGGKYLAWSEEEKDHRWNNRSYGEIRIYDFTTGKIRQLTRRTRYFSPVINSEGNRIAAVQVSVNNQHSIDILDVPSGRLIRKFPVPDHGAAMTPNWLPDNKKILFTLLTAHGETVALLDTTTGKIEHLIPFTFHEFNGPGYFFNQYLIYGVDYSGTEDLYALDTLTHQIFQVTSSRFAALDPDCTPDHQFMIYSDYTSDGMMVVEIRIDPSTWIPLHLVRDHSLRLYEPLALQEKANIQDSVLLRNIFRLKQNDSVDFQKDTIKGTVYPSVRYRKAAHLFNPHSWAPLSFNAGDLTFHPGVMALSQNLLSSMVAGAGWEYDLNERTGKCYANLSYTGWYPVFTVQFDIGNRAGYTRYEGSHEKYRFTWQETNLKFKTAIPWNFSHGRFNRSLQPEAGFSLIGIQHHHSTPENFTSGSIWSLDYRLTASQYQRSSPKDMYPPLGLSIEINYRHTPFGSNDMGSIASAAANLYFPGIFKHQGFWFYFAWQKREANHHMAYSYANMVAYPRGYHDNYDEEVITAGINYKFPILCPDLSLGSVVYLKRLKLNFYYDWANGLNPGEVTTFQTTGAELTADLHLLRFAGPIELGVRSLYFPATGTWGCEFLYAISL